MQAVSVPRQITKRKIQPVDFVQVCASSGRPMGLYANDCTFNGNTVAQSRFEIVNRDTKNATRRAECDLPPLGHNPSSLQYKGKCITGAENLGAADGG